MPWRCIENVGTKLNLFYNSTHSDCGQSTLCSGYFIPCERGPGTYWTDDQISPRNITKLSDGEKDRGREKKLWTYTRLWILNTQPIASHFTQVPQLLRLTEIKSINIVFIKVLTYKWPDWSIMDIESIYWMLLFNSQYKRDVVFFRFTWNKLDLSWLTKNGNTEYQTILLLFLVYSYSQRGRRISQSNVETQCLDKKVISFHAAWCEFYDIQPVVY